MADAARLQAAMRAQLGQLTLSVELSLGTETLVLIGPNGAGKSSVLLLLLGVHPLLEGHVTLGDTVLYDQGRGIALPVAERKLGYLPQSYGLFPHLTVEQNIDFAVRSACSARGGRNEALLCAQVSDALQALGLDDLKHRYPTRLSGGEQQRVALARALSIKPRALLLDEPLAALDVHARRKTRSFLADTLQKLALPTLIVTHDPEDARTLGQKIAVMEAGRITQLGSWYELTTAPATAFVAEFVGA